MSELIDRLRADFQDEEYRHSYAEECLNTMIATQIKVLREQRDMSQSELAEKTGMKQPRIPLLEDANYSNWTVNTLKRFARAFGVTLTVRFDTFSDLILDFESMSREALERPSFADDPLFKSSKVTTSRRFKRHRRVSPEAERAAFGLQRHLFTGVLAEMSVPPQTASAIKHAEQPKVNNIPVVADKQLGGSHAISIGAAG